MIKNYLKIAIRSLKKQKEYAVINITGLSIGMAVCMLITLFVTDELSYDNFHKNGDNIYRMALERMYPDHSTFYAVIPHSFAEVLPVDYAEVEATCRVNVNNANIVVRYEDKNGNEKVFEESNFYHADSNFYSFFSYNLINGNKEEALLKPASLTISSTAAKKYFGNEDPIGKVLETDLGEYSVTGVFEDMPENSHIQCELLGSFNSLPFAENLNYMAFSAATYLQLQPEASAIGLEAKLPAMVENYAAAQVEDRLKISFKAYQDAGNGYRYFLQPLQDIHLKSNLEGELDTNGNLSYVYIFISIAVFILIIASINFMNLATAKSAERAKEVGIRKVMGSNKRQLIRQFLSESVVISGISLLVALVIVTIALPYFNQLFDKSIHLNLFSSTYTIPLLIIFTVMVGLVAGIYPAFVLSAYNPVSVLKGKLINSARGSWLRSGLVIFQFFISIILISGILAIYNQMNFLQQKNLGYEKDQVLIIDRAAALGQQWEVFNKEVSNLPGVKNIGHTSATPGAPSAFFFGIQFQPKGSSEVLTTKGMVVDDQFIDVLKLEIVAGRGFSPDIDDSLSVILNESAATTLGIGNPIGAQITNKTNNPFANGPANVVYTIVGIVKDFNFQSLRDHISPLALLNPGFENPVGFGSVAVKIKGTNLKETIAAIEQKWSSISGNEPFNYSFLDDDVNANYIAEQNSGRLLSIFTGLAILIACIGLFGLAAFIGQQRTKEIGIRKTLGATTTELVIMLSNDFTKLVALAILIAIPVSWYLINEWLQNFAYSTTISAWIFVIAGGSALVIALLTVSYQAIKSAIVNPIKSLKSE